MTTAILIFITSLALSYTLFPAIIMVLKKYKLLDLPGGRKIHTNMTPLMGGLPIFIGFALAVVIWMPVFYIAQYKFLIAGLIMVLILGVRDDLTVLRAREKLVGQILIASFLFFFCNVQLNSLFGLFGVYAISPVLSYITTVFTIVVITNSYNLIDGIDGLAGSIGLIIVSLFGIWFFATGDFHLSYFCFAIAGGIVAFLSFNWAPSKIFLGDTGAAFIGAFIAACAIYFINKNYLLDAGVFKFNANIATAIGLLIIPILDTIRIFIKRVANGKSPLLPDKNHLHHMLLDLGFNHGQGTTILIGTNISFILLVIGLKNYTDFIVLPSVIALSFSLIMFLEVAHRKAMVIQEKEAVAKPIKQIFIKKSA